MSQAGTNDVTSYATHCNGILFTDKTWHKHISNDDYKHIPTQIRKLIGFAKANNFTEKQVAFQEEQQQNKRNKKRGVSQVSQVQEDDIVDRAISTIAKRYQDKIASSASSSDSGTMVPYVPDAKADSKSNANAGSAFRKQNATGGNR